ncbi:UNVERIFIED_CONTAM: hypothetical protein Sradi_3586100 [Sesamum radiatum]|uniref:GRF-type domain-containing protein n=1 Tax=Sesamum radiatum TaxID=300843 RepID=A0AAW2QGU5_SESRA
MEYSFSADSAVVRTCLCGLEVVVRTSWTNANPDRRFRGCPGEGGSYCNVFQWVDPPMCPRAKEIIPDLIAKIADKDVQLTELRQQLCTKMSLEHRGMTNRLLVVILVVSAIFTSITYDWAMKACA